MTLEEAMAEIGQLSGSLMDAGKFLLTLGGEHSITSPIVGAAAKRWPGVSVLQIDAHADLRASYLGEAHSHACAMRRTLDFAPLVQVGIRNMSEEEAQALPGLRTTIFWDWNMRDDPQWIDRVVAALNSSSHSRRLSKAALVRQRLAMLRKASREISVELARVPGIALSAQT